jgi:hypothetical protein
MRVLNTLLLPYIELIFAHKCLWTQPLGSLRSGKLSLAPLAGRGPG